MENGRSNLIVYGALMSLSGIESLAFDQIKNITIANTRRGYR